MIPNYDELDNNIEADIHLEEDDVYMMEVKNNYLVQVHSEEHENSCLAEYCLELNRLENVLGKIKKGHYDEYCSEKRCELKRLGLKEKMYHLVCLGEEFCNKTIDNSRCLYCGKIFENNLFFSQHLRVDHFEDRRKKDEVCGKHLKHLVKEMSIF